MAKILKLFQGLLLACITARRASVLLRSTSLNLHLSTVGGSHDELADRTSVLAASTVSSTADPGTTTTFKPIDLLPGRFQVCLKHLHTIVALDALAASLGIVWIKCFTAVLALDLEVFALL